MRGGEKEMANKEGNVTWDDAGDYTWTVFLTKKGWKWLVYNSMVGPIESQYVPTEADGFNAVQQKLQELGVSMQR
jgi:hypothetical protein